MIDLYTARTPNGQKIPIMLEETGLEYTVHMVSLAGDQFKPEFLSKNPNNKIPVIVDQDGPGGEPLTLFESGAILIYLAEKSVRFMPLDPAGRALTIQWVMFQMANLGPMLGQYGHFAQSAKEKIPYAIERYSKEVDRLLGVTDKRLGESAFLAGDYSIADITTYPWLWGYANYYKQDVTPWPNIVRWLDVVGARPAVQRGMSFEQG